MTASQFPQADPAGRFAGTVARAALASRSERHRTVSDLVDVGAPIVSASSRLDVALESLTEAPLLWVPVLDDDRRVVGTLSISDVVRAYRQELVASAERVSELGGITGASQMTITADSPIANKALRWAGLPKGLLITSITRGDQVFVPNGDTVLVEGDHLSALGQPSDLKSIGQIDPLGTESLQPHKRWPVRHRE